MAEGFLELAIRERKLASRILQGRSQLIVTTMRAARISAEKQFIPLSLTTPILIIINLVFVVDDADDQTGNLKQKME